MGEKIERIGDEVVAKGYRAGATKTRPQGWPVPYVASGEKLKITIKEIGGWDMKADADKAVAHGLTFADIRFCMAAILNDAGDELFILPTSTGASGADARFARDGPPVDGTNVNLTRTTSGKFDATAYNDDTINRGWIGIFHV